jgi:2-iminobutanoate/2-iminopropanoate deaminase
VVIGGALLTAACTSSPVSGVGGRPLIYKQGPGNAPDQVEPASTSRPAAPAVKPAPSATSVESQTGTAPATVPATAAVTTQPGAALPPALARYTQAARYGDLLFLSGQIPIDPVSGAFAADATVELQTRQVLENIRTILEVHRLTMSNIVSVTVYLVNINSLAAVDSVYPSFFKGALPARSVVEVARLPRNAQLEISVVAGR